MNDIVSNADVLDGLYRAMQRAREFRIESAGVVLTGKTRSEIFTVGDTRLLPTMIDESKRLTEMLVEDEANGQWPERDVTLDRSYACFNLLRQPLCFDFIVWLIDAEMARVRHGRPGPLKVGFWKGKDPAKREAYYTSWLDNVFRPALSLIGAVEDDRAVNAGKMGHLTTKRIVEACGAEETVPLLTTDLRYPGRPPVTITLREATHWPHRNSNLIAWMKFAADLRMKGERVVFLRDTAKAFEGLGDFETDPLASIDLQWRMARYLSAKANLFVSNGPATLGVFSDRPWMQFVTLEAEDSGYEPNSPAFWREQQGVEPGGQYPWSDDNQRLIWGPDTYRNISAAWEQLEC